MSFVGNITAKESFDELISSTDSVLIDVRSSRELCVDGVAVLENHPEKLLFCEWRSENPQNEKRKFLDDLFARINFQLTSRLYFICRSGIRSLEAASYVGNELSKTGVNIMCLNISDGFEGNALKMFGFGERNGLKAAGLPVSKASMPDGFRGVRLSQLTGQKYNNNWKKRWALVPTKTGLHL